MFSKESLTAEAVATLKSKYGPELRAVHTPVGILVLRKPTREEFDRWQDKKLSSDDHSPSANARELVQSCLAGCSYEDMITALDAKPGLLLGELLMAIQEMVGRDKKDVYEVEKL